MRLEKANVATEVIAGITTFMAMAYILAVNPNILSCAGMPRGGVMIATALAAFIGTGLMALLSNYPFALAPGMGLNAFFAFTVCGAMGYSWQFALLAVFIEGLIFLALSLTPVREGIFNAIPLTLKKAVAAGIGLFITIIALENAKILVDNPATLVSLVSFKSVDFCTQGITAILALAGTLITAIMLKKRIPGAILLGIIATWILGIVCELAGVYKPDFEKGFFPLIPAFGDYFTTLKGSFKDFGSICGALFNSGDWTLKGSEQAGMKLLFSMNFFVVIFAFFFVDLFDTLGTLIGVSMKGGMLDKEGKLPRISGALCADSVATSVGAILGTSTTTTYVESASGVSAGGRTGLTAWVTAALFLVAILLAPIFLAIPAFATAPALIVVGFLMMGSVAGIDFEDVGEAFPAFICIAAMPFFYSISEGIMFGIISYTVINACCGKKIHWLMYVLSVLFVAKYIFL